MGAYVLVLFNFFFFFIFFSVFCLVAGMPVWDDRQLARFNWIWHECTTFEPYTAETAFVTSVLGDLSHVSVASVLKVVH